MVDEEVLVDRLRASVIFMGRSWMQKQIKDLDGVSVQLIQVKI